MGRWSYSIVVSRPLSNLEKDYIPMRVGNLSSVPKQRRKGTEIAVCEPDASITPTNLANKEQGEASSKEPVPEHLQSLFESSRENRCYRDKKKVAELVGCFQDNSRKGLKTLDVRQA